MSRNPRSTTPCRPRPSGSRSGADTGATAVAQPAGTCRARPKTPQAQSTIPRRGPPPCPPKKIDYKKPQMTRAMQHRLQHAKRMQEEMERKDRERAQGAECRRPKRCPAPTGGDARMGREPSQRRAPPEAERKCRRPGSGKERTRATCSRPESQPQPSCAPSTSAAAASRPQRPCSRERSPCQVPARTLNLAKSMNADIVQAEALQKGPVDNLIIPPGAINSEKTTIVSIPQPEPANQIASSTLASGPGNTSCANRSAQIISETLDEQDAAEASVVNNKLQDLQQARRDFVMAVANVGNNAINLQDEEFPSVNVTPIAEITPPMMMSPEPPSPGLIKCPSLEDPYLLPEYGRNHPAVEAARDYMRMRQTGRCIDEDFARIASEQPEEDFELDYLDGGPGDGGDDEICMTSGNYTVIPRRREAFRYDPLEIDRLERFFDLDNYPPPPPTPPPPGPRGPPPGRENLHQDLWELDDPWYRQPSVPDLIDWQSNC